MVTDKDKIVRGKAVLVGTKDKVGSVNVDMQGPWLKGNLQEATSVFAA